MSQNLKDRNMLRLFFILCSTLFICNAYKLLVVFPVPSKSHSILGQGFVRHLLDAGHEITYITPMPVKNPAKGLRQIDVSENARVLSPEIFDISKILSKEFNLQDYTLWKSVMTEVSAVTLNTKVVQDFLKNTVEKFDAVIIEWLFTELGAGFATIFNCPLIWSSSMAPHTHVISLINEHLNPAYTRNLLSTTYSLDFWDRVSNLWTMLKIWYFNREFLDTEKKIYEEAFGPAAALRKQQLPQFKEIKYNASLMFGNSHISVEDIIALPHNYKNIGGYHIDAVPDPLSQNLQEIMDNATDGVIYFSLGSLLQTHKMPLELKRRFLDVFGALKQTVIWKLGEDLPDLPKNVHLVSWAPQQSILAHPNCVLFITHAGLLSILEVVFFGVPIIGLPFFADQYLNIDRVVARGFAKRLDLNYDTPAELEKAIGEIMSNSSYHQRAKEWSSIYHDRLISPGKELVFWVEHVIKTRGATHLRSIAMKMEWYKKFYLDLVAAILVLGVIVYYASSKIIASHLINHKKKTA